MTLSPFTQHLVLQQEVQDSEEVLGVTAGGSKKILFNNIKLNFNNLKHVLTEFVFCLEYVTFMLMCILKGNATSFYK